MQGTCVKKIKSSAYVIPSIRKTKFRDNKQEEEKIIILEFNAADLLVQTYTALKCSSMAIFCSAFQTLRLPYKS